jgi:hypothetical protein
LKARDIARELRCALDPAAFAREKLAFVPDSWQERVLRSSARQLILNCSRQSGKSSVTAIIATHTAIYKPGSLTLLVSKAQRQSAELLHKVQAFLRSVTPGVALESDSVLSAKLANGSRIISLPGDGDSIRGFSAPTLVVEDEAAFVGDALYFSIRPMLAVSDHGRILLLSSPRGKRRHFYETFVNGGHDWERFSVKATQVPRISAAFLQQELDAMGEWWFKQEYMTEFVDTSDQLFSSASIDAAIAPDLAPLEIAL